MLRRALTEDMLFADAFKAWIARRTLDLGGAPTDARYLAARTDRDYRCCARALERFPVFQKLQLGQLGPHHLMDYQRARATNPPDPAGAWWAVGPRKSQGPFPDHDAAERWAREHGGPCEVQRSVWPRRAGANRIRKEITLLVRLLRDARLWGEEEEEAFLRLRPVESEMVRALTTEEQHRFLHVAASRKEFRFVYQYAIVALQTTASTNEMRALRLRDVFLANRIIQVPPAGAKNTYRMRAIPIVTDDCAWALEGLMGRARDLGATEPGHYLFPKRVNPGRCAETASPGMRYDAAKPMSDSGLKKQWDVVRRAAGLPDLRVYDLRHTGITRMAEAGVPLAVAMTFAGHMTRQMQQRYTAVCMASQRGWGATVWGSGGVRENGGAAELSALPPHKPVGVETGSMYKESNLHFHRGN